MIRRSEGWVNHVDVRYHVNEWKKMAATIESGVK